MINPSLPLIDLHRHLDGSVRLSTILDLGHKHNISLPDHDIEGLRPHVQVSGQQPGVMAFIEKFHWMTAILADYDACRRIAFECVQDLASEGIDYAELRFSPWFMAETHQLNPQGVVEAVIDGFNAGKHATGIKANLIGILSRTYGPEIAWRELDAILSQRNHFVAVDLAGDEANWPGELFVGHFKTVKEAGLRITIHAGESAGAQSIWQAIRELSADRIGHAVHAPEDPRLLHYIAELNIGVEVNLTSNVQTSTVPDYPSHPLKIFLEQGILASINTDDPGISGIDILHEYEVAAPKAGLTKAQINRLQENALTTAFLTNQEKKLLVAKKYVL
jgi:adenosine deaminase